MKHLYRLLALSFLLGLGACRESGQDPLADQQQAARSERTELLAQVDKLLSQVWDDPLGVGRSLSKLYPPSIQQLHSDDPELISALGYLRTAQRLSELVSTARTLAQGTPYDHYQPMVISTSRYGSDYQAQIATDPTVLLWQRARLEAALRRFQQQEAPSYSVRSESREAALVRAVQQRGLASIDSVLASYKAFTGREQELAGTQWQQQGYDKGASLAWNIYQWIPSKLQGKINFGSDHALGLDLIQTPKVYGNFPYGYEGAKIFDAYDKRGTGFESSIYSAESGHWDSTQPQRYFFGDEYLTLVLPMSQELGSTFGRYTVVWTLRYQPELFRDKQELEVSYDSSTYGPERANYYIYISIYDETKHYGTQLLKRDNQYGWNAPMRFVKHSTTAR